MAFHRKGIYNRIHFLKAHISFSLDYFNTSCIFVVFERTATPLFLITFFKKKYCFFSWKQGCSLFGFRALLHLMCSSLSQLTCPLSFAIWQKLLLVRTNCNAFAQLLDGVKVAKFMVSTEVIAPCIMF